MVSSGTGLGIIYMKTLLTFALLLCATVIHAAIPDYKAFIGTNGITVRSNPPNGFIFIDGIGVGGATGAVTQVQLTAASNSLVDFTMTTTVSNANVRYVAVDGNDSTAKVGRPDKPWLTATGVNAVAVSGDKVIFGPGDFSVGSNLFAFKHGVSYEGQGIGSTRLRGTNNMTNIPQFSPGSEGVVHDLTIITRDNDTFHFGLGRTTGQQLATNAFWYNIRHHGDSDGVFLKLDEASNETFSWRLVNCVFDNSFDSIVFGGSTNARLSFINCVFNADLLGETNTQNTSRSTRFISLNNGSASGGTLEFDNCTFVSKNAALAYFMTVEEAEGKPYNVQFRNVAVSLVPTNGGSTVPFELYIGDPALLQDVDQTNFFASFANFAPITVQQTNSFSTNAPGPQMILLTRQVSQTNYLPNLSFVGQRLFHGLEIGVKDGFGNAGTSNKVIFPIGGATINGATSYVLNNDNQSAVFTQDRTGTNWVTIADSAMAIGSGDVTTTQLNTASNLLRSDISGLTSRAITNRDSRPFSLSAPFTNYNAMYVNAGFAYINNRLAPESFNTNYVITLYETGQDEWYLIMTNHVHFRDFANGIQDPAYRGFAGVTITNFTATDKTLTFTNTWVALGVYPSVVPAGKTARVEFEYDAGGIPRYSVQVQDTGGSGSGDVFGPASVTDKQVAIFGGTTGDRLTNSLVTIDPDTSETTITSSGEAILNLNAAGGSSATLNFDQASTTYFYLSLASDIGSLKITEVASGNAVATFTSGALSLNGNLTVNSNATVTGKSTLNGDIIIPWRGGVAASTVIYATNGPNQTYHLGSNTNFTFAPLSGTDASNSIAIAVEFIQNSTGGFYPTINGSTNFIATNANAKTMVYIRYAQGSTNVASETKLVQRYPANGHTWMYDEATGTFTNIASTGTGTVVRNTSPTLVTPILGAATASSISITGNESVNSIEITNSLAFVNQTVLGVGGANTNFTGLWTHGKAYVDGGTTNVNFVAFMPGTAGLTYYLSYSISNLTTTARNISLSSVTNRIHNLQQYYGIAPPYVLTNKHTGELQVELTSTNAKISFLQYTNGF